MIVPAFHVTSRFVSKSDNVITFVMNVCVTCKCFLFSIQYIEEMSKEVMQFIC